MNEKISSCFEKLFDTYHLAVWKFAFSLCKSQVETEDLFQETWLKVVKHMNKVTEINNIKAWLFSITINSYRDVLRRQQKRPFLSPSPKGLLTEQNRERSFGQSQKQMKAPQHEKKIDFTKAIEKALLSLPEKQRLVFILKEKAGFPLSEISEILNLPLGTVKSLLYRAVRHLQKELGPYYPKSRPMKRRPE